MFLCSLPQSRDVIVTSRYSSVTLYIHIICYALAHFLSLCHYLIVFRACYFIIVPYLFPIPYYMCTTGPSIPDSVAHATPYPC